MFPFIKTLIQLPFQSKNLLYDILVASVWNFSWKCAFFEIIPCFTHTKNMFLYSAKSCLSSESTNGSAMASSSNREDVQWLPSSNSPLTIWELVPQLSVSTFCTKTPKIFFCLDSWNFHHPGHLLGHPTPTGLSATSQKSRDISWSKGHPG